MVEMTDIEIDRKHVCLRGSLRSKYPPREVSCRKQCECGDYYKFNDRPAANHRCFLADGHKGPCEFSSECAYQRENTIA